MKLIKKISYLVIAFAFMLVEFAAPISTSDNVEAASKTLRTMKKELAQLEAELASNKREQQAAQSTISSSKKEIENLSKQKENIADEIISLTNEITELGVEIKNMNEEIKDIVSYFQLSSAGDSGELEYIFTAESSTDFIYRLAVSEQLSKYNADTIAKYNKKISDNEDKKEQLADKQVELNKKEGQLETVIKKQQNTLSSTMEGAVSLEEEIKSLKKLVNVYENTYKCKLDETIDQCLHGRLPAGTAFYRPITSGRVTSNYGGRSYVLNGKWTSDFHYAVDFSGAYKSPVYSTANGQVAAVFTKQSCGGNMVYINHIVNGKKYTSGYYHLASVNVKVGQNVTYNTQIGQQGGSSKEYWDRCSTGTHVHFSMATGNWGSTYKNYSGFISHNVNPRNVVNIPALGSSFTSRWIKY